MRPLSAALSLGVLVASMLTVPVGAEPETVAIAFEHPRPPAVLSDQAAALLSATNASRREAGLPALRRDPALDAFALAYAREMIARRFFGHTTPDGVTFRDRLLAAKFPFSVAEENIALDRDAVRAHSAFLGSTGHRDNLLSRDVDRMGVAAVDGGAQEVVFVEEFAR